MRIPVSLWGAAVVLLGACSDPGVLQVDLIMNATTLGETDRVRIVISDPMGGFQPSGALAGAPTNERVRNIDLDGDGRAEIVADLQTDFKFLRNTTYLKVVPQGGAAARTVNVSAQAINRYGNPIGAIRDLGSRLPGGSIKLTIDCGSNCAGTALPALSPPIPLIDATLAAHPVSAVAAKVGFAAVGIAEAGATPAEAGAAAMPNRGQVSLLRPNAAHDAIEVAAQLTGERPGDLFGASLAIGDLDGDGQDDLIVGAPGVRDAMGNTVGAVYVLFGGLSSLSGAVSTIPHVTILGDPGDLLGASVAVFLSNGKPAVVAGAPGAEPAGASPAADPSAGRVYLVESVTRAVAPLTVATLNAATLKRAQGAASGVHLGRSVAATAGLVAAGAPGDNAVYFLNPADDKDFALTAQTVARIWSTGMAGGGVGSAVAILDTNADGKPEVAVTAPGGETVYVIAVTDAAPTDADVMHVMRSTVSAVSLGASLARVPGRFGDRLVVGTSPQPGAIQGAMGAALILTGDSLVDAGAQLPLAFDSARAAGTVLLGDAIITQAAGADFFSSADLPGLVLVVGDSLGRVSLQTTGGAL